MQRMLGGGDRPGDGAGLRLRIGRRMRSSGVGPLLRLFGWGLRSLCARALLALRAPFATPARRAEALAAWRRDCARRAADRLGELKGLYVKLGQFGANRLDLLPAEFSEALGALRDRVPGLPLAQIRPLIETELGAPLEQLFAAFDPEPVGAASIAQVHRARLPGGDEVVVKVQYPWLAESLAADLALARIAFTWLAPSRRNAADRRRLFEEFRAGLTDELDFRREARVAREIAANLAEDERVVVPEVVASHSSQRVLTMRHLPVIPIHDHARLDALGVDRSALLDVLGRAYARQVFVDGLFHADPHPGNLFVIDEPEAAQRPRILFVDFGLSRRLDPELREEIRKGAFALIQRNLDEFFAGMQRMDMIEAGCEKQVRAALEAMFERIRSQGGALAVPGSQVLALKDQAKALLQETPGLQLPNDLLLFAKTLSYVFALGSELAPQADLMRICLPYLMRFLAGAPPPMPPVPARSPAA